MTKHNHPDRSTSYGSSLMTPRRGLLTAGAAVASVVAFGAVPTTAAAVPDANGVICGIEHDGNLLWYRHEGRGVGTARWANNGRVRKIGNGWDFAHVFPGNQRAKRPGSSGAARARAPGPVDVLADRRAARTACA